MQDNQRWFGGVHRPATRPGLSGSQALGHPGTAGSLGRTNRVEACRLDLARGWGQKWKLQLVPQRESLAWWQQTWWRLWLGVQRGLCRRLHCGSIGKGLLHGGFRWKETVHGSKPCIAMMESRYPTSQVRPEIKYLLQEGMSVKGLLLAIPSRPYWRSLSWAYMTTGHFSFLLFWSEMLGMPQLHVEGLGALPLHGWWPQIYEGLRLVMGALVPGSRWSS